MGMENKEKTLDWLYRLRSEIYVYMPKEWLIPMNNALDVGIDTVKREELLEDWTKKCRKFEADYENRLKADLVAMLEEIQLELDEMKITKVRSAGFAVYSKDPFRRGVNCSKEIIQQKINSLKEKDNGNK